MRTLLIVVHSLTGGASQMADAACAGAMATATEMRTPVGEEPVAVVLREAPHASVDAVRAADGYLFAAPETLGSMSGLMKDFFDRTYYAVLDRIAGRPFAVLICAGNDGSGAARQVVRIATGWRLRAIAPPLIVHTGAQTPEAILAPKTIGAPDMARCKEIGATLAAGMAAGVF